MIAGFIILLYNSARRHREPYVKRAADAGAASAEAAAEQSPAANDDVSAPAGDNIDQTDTVQEENNDA